MLSAKLRNWCLCAGVLAASGAVAVVATGCGSGGVSGDPVAEAATFTANSGTLHTRVSVKYQRGNGSMTLRGLGEESLKDRSASIAMSVPGQGSIRAIALGHTIYFSTPQIAKQVGKPWGKVDIDKVAKGRGIDLSSLNGIQASDASSALDALKSASGGDTKRVGSETIDGSKTTHYHATIDLNQVPNRVKPSQRAEARRSVQRLIQLVGKSKISEDVWIDGRHRVRQVHYLQPVNPQASADITMTFFDYGQAVSIHAPPSSQVKDITKQVGGA
jgi:hypothetical protein